MAYQVLARKWRPRNFREMAGQTHVLHTLINALDNQRLHHAYLFTGTRGVGKTTIARILAKCLNCETGITSSPCGQCSACVEISEGRFLDLIEVDAASRTKVEDTRELLENVQYAPSRGRFKVYLIDEVHMLSTHSFNALLKTLEEPPPHVKFLLATTDPQKLPVTVLSRCLQFNLKNLSPERLVEHLRYILGEEKIPFEEAALWQLGRAAQGSVRDCLTLLDQAIGFCNGNITDSGVREFLGNIDRSVIVSLMAALIAQDGAAVLQQVANAAEHAPDFAVILQELLSWLHRLAIAQAVPGAIDNSQGDRDQVVAQAASLPAETVQLYYQIALKGREDMPFALDARSGLEMTLLRMLVFTPAGIVKMPQTSLPAQQAATASAAQASPAGDGQKKKSLAEPAPRAVSTAIVEIAVEVDVAADVKPGVETAVAAEPQRAAPLPIAARATPPHSAAAPAHTATVTARDNSAASAKPLSAQNKPVAATALQTPTLQSDESEIAPVRIRLADLKPAMWIDLFRALKLSGVSRSIAANSILRDVSGNHLSLMLQESQATLFNDEHRKRIESSLSDYFEMPVVLQMQVGAVLGETPSAWRARRDQERQQAAVKTFTEDALVNAIVERFNAEIQYDSITPLTPPDWH